MGRGSGMERSDAPVGGIQRVADRVLESADDELSVTELNSRGDSLDEKVESLRIREWSWAWAARSWMRAAALGPR